MKCQYSKKLWLVALPFAWMVTACQNELVNTDCSMDMDQESLMLHAVMGNYANPQTRAQVKLDNLEESQEYFMWNNDDSFTLYNTENTAVSSTFTIAGYNEENPSAEAGFLGKGEFADGTAVTAIYPNQEEAVVTNNVVTLSISDFGGAPMGDNSKEDQKEYMSERMFMYADATINRVGTNIEFNQLCAMARISYTNATDTEQSISQLTLSGSDEFFGEKMDFDLVEKTRSVSFTSTSTGLTFDGLVVPSGKTVDFYLLFFPGKSFESDLDGNLTISLSETLKAEIPIRDIVTTNGGCVAFESGKRYWFNLMQTKNEGLIRKKDLPENVIANLPLIGAVERSNNMSFIKDANGLVNVDTNKELIESITYIELLFVDYLVNTEGIEKFENLDSLFILTDLRSLDVSKNLKLKKLVCSDNALSKLDVSANTQLEYLDCSYNQQLTELNVSNNKALKHLNCRETIITTLDVGSNPELEVLNCSDCRLSSLDITNNPNIEYLQCGDNHDQDGADLWLMLTLNKDQQNMWEQMLLESGNMNVTAVVKE